MQASAANGYMATILGNCNGVPFNYEPEYDTASPQNIVPWAALLGGNTFGGAGQYGAPTARFFGTVASDILTNAITC